MAVVPLHGSSGKTPAKWCLQKLVNFSPSLNAETLILNKPGYPNRILAMVIPPLCCRGCVVACGDAWQVAGAGRQAGGGNSIVG